MNPELPTRIADDPVKAWKIARITSTPEYPWKLHFRGAVMPLRYLAEPSTFVCGCSAGSINAPPHSKIGLSTNCGFYGLKAPQLDPTSRMMSWSNSGQFYLLEVEFWGTVIRGENGYRASRQRVLSCRPYGAPHREEIQGQYPLTLLHDEKGMFKYPSYTGPKQRFSVADITSKLGTEVIYDESVLAVGWQREVDTKVGLKELYSRVESFKSYASNYKKFYDD
jgi:hypothetical protein